jgi:predicted transcriptional regulator YdeE
MDKNIVQFSADRYFVGMKYPDVIYIDQSVDLPSFWTTFSEKFYASTISHLIDKKEAIGYMNFSAEKKDDRSYEYVAACEVSQFGETDGFEKLEIPKGEYVFYDIRFADKEAEIKSVLNSLEQLPDICFEFYPESFNHEEKDTRLFFVIPKQP